MIQNFSKEHVPAITEIYNRYITESTASFEVQPLTAEQMEARAVGIAASYPYYVAIKEGCVVGYCYAHPWKERAAYGKTLETTIYLAEDAQHAGIGHQLMETLIEDCRRRGFRSLIACITAENTASCLFHESLGFKKVSFFEEVGEKFGRLLSVVDYQLKL